MEKISLLTLQKLFEKMKLLEKNGSTFLSSSDYQECIDLLEEIEQKIENENSNYIDYKDMVNLCKLMIFYLETGKTEKLEEEYYKIAH